MSHPHYTCRGVPSYFRVVSLMRLPSSKGTGIYNEAHLYHDDAELTVCWHSNTVDVRLKRGCIVDVHGPLTPLAVQSGKVITVNRLTLIDKPLASINPFTLIPTSWVPDRQLVTEAISLWASLGRGLMHLINAVLWDGGRFYRYVTVRSASPTHAKAANGIFRQAVMVARESWSLVSDMADAATSVVVGAGLLHVVGKAEDYCHHGDAESLSERGILLGYQITVLEWLAVARTKVIIPDALYLPLLHALLAAREDRFQGKSIEASILSVARRIAAEGAGGTVRRND